MSIDNQWHDKVILVTGGASGMGRDVSLTLANLGAKIVIGNRNSQAGQAIIDEIINSGGQAVFKVTDVSVADDCEALVQFALETYGCLDAAFNNSSLLTNITFADCKYDFDVACLREVTVISLSSPVARSVCLIDLAELTVMVSVL